MTGHWLPSPAAQLCQGLAVTAGEGLSVRCARCGHQLVDGSPVSALVVRSEGGPFRVDRLVCVRCPLGAVATLGVCGLELEGSLGVLQEAGRQSHELVLCDVEVTRMSPAGEGGREAWLDNGCRAGGGRDG
jgi:hypothetical protein